MPFWDNVESTVQPDRPQMIIRRMRIACWTRKAKHKLRMCNTHCSSVPTTAARPRLSVTSLVQYTACLWHIFNETLAIICQFRRAETLANPTTNRLKTEINLSYSTYLTDLSCMTSDFAPCTVHTWITCKLQSVPRSKHIPSVQSNNRCLFSDQHKPHK